MKQLAPGIYVDGGTMHLVLSELLDAHGYADTPDNRQKLIEACKEMFEGPVELVD